MPRRRFPPYVNALPIAAAAALFAVALFRLMPAVRPAGVSVDASWAQGYVSLKAMAAQSSAVTEVQVVTAVDSTVDSAGIPYTDFEVKILRVIRGRLPATVIVHQTGSAHFMVSDDPLLQVGATYILFVHQYQPGHVFVLGGPEGRYVVLQQAVYSLNHVTPRVGIPKRLDAFEVPLATFVREITGQSGPSSGA